MNVGRFDRNIRLGLGLVLVAASFFMLGGPGTTAGLLTIIVGAVLVVTALTKFCPLYKLLGLSTRRSHR